MCKIVVVKKSEIQLIERNVNKLSDHLWEDSVEENFKCDYNECDKSFKLKSSLFKH
jgi:hypothetical protein